jgi:hypothetical protein
MKTSHPRSLFVCYDICMSTSSFQELQYKQPSIKISEAAEKAVLIIKDILNVVPAAMPFILEPSALLLFANLRAESPYHLLGDALDSDQVSKLDVVLAKHGIYRFTEELPAESAYPGEEVFSLINPTMLNAIPSQYACMKEIWTPLNLAVPFRYAYIEWAFVTERALAKLMEDGKLPTDWLKDWWAPHNLRFGMLLGYPGVAISSALWSEARDRSGMKKRDAMIELVVAIDKQYFGTQVAFYINRAVINNQSVVNIKDTWEKVIAQIYNDISFAELMNNEDFASSYKKLKLRETDES